MFKDMLQPGAVAPEQGTYWVHHYQHRVTHPVAIAQGERLPECAVCHERVRYELDPAGEDAPPMGDDKDLRQPPGAVSEPA